MMSGGLPIALMIVPLACYFFLLGFWHAWPHPHVISGQVDFAALVCGVLGLLTFGPPGKFMVEHLFPEPNLWAWLAVPTFFGLLALLWAPRTARRLIVYNVEPELLKRAFDDVARESPVALEPAENGYRDRAGSRTVTLEVGFRSHVGLVEVRGPLGDRLVQLLAPRLRSRLRSEESRPLLSSWVWFALSLLVLVGPTVGTALRRPQIQSAFRVFFDRILR
jgi:hypothetical protein